MKPNLPTAFDIAKSKGYTEQQILAGFGGKEARDAALGVKKTANLTEKQILAGFGGKTAKDKLISGETKSLLSTAISHLAVIDSIFKARLDAFSTASVQSSLKRKEADIERKDTTRAASSSATPAEVGGNTLIVGILIAAAIPLFKKIADIFPGVIEGFKAVGSTVVEFVSAIGTGVSYIGDALKVLDPIVESDTYKWLKKSVGLGDEKIAPAEGNKEGKPSPASSDLAPNQGGSGFSGGGGLAGGGGAAVSIPAASQTSGSQAGKSESKAPLASTSSLVKARDAQKTGEIYKDITPEGAALLSVIAGTESTGYDVIYGGTRMSDYGKDYSDHPRIPIPIKSGPNKGLFSSAAGKYQFIRRTWDALAKKYNLTDFSPKNQDKAAWYLAQEDYSRRTHRVLQDDLMSGDQTRLNLIATNLNETWTSLTGGIEQSKQYKKVTFASKYAGALQDVENSAIADSSAMAAAKNKTPGTVVATAGSPSGSSKSKPDFGSAGISDPTQDWLKRLAA